MVLNKLLLTAHNLGNITIHNICNKEIDRDIAVELEAFEVIKSTSGLKDILSRN
jgi:hypothetical protein